jgi:2'-5' RNA ligase
LNGIRTFVAVAISKETKRRIERYLRPVVEGSDRSIRWTPAERWHVTLAFLGDVDTSQVIDVCRSASQIAEDVAPFEWRVKPLGAFPNARNPRVVWLGVDDLEQRMMKLHEALAAAYRGLGLLADDRPFRPHVTVGRSVRGRDVPAALQAYLADPPRWDGPVEQVDSIQVLSSNLGRAGESYSVLAAVPLVGESSSK